VPGWTLKDGNVTRDDSGSISLGSDPGPDVIHADWDGDEECLFCTPLQRRLLPPPLGRILVVDEKPLQPDVPEALHLTTMAVKAPTTGRSNNWTVTPWLTNDGELASATIIVTGHKSIDCESLSSLFKEGFHFAAADNGLQSEQTFTNDLEAVFKKVFLLIQISELPIPIKINIYINIDYH
tara:strand:+ start:1109 stop:1651 length:543 start_codon:yes stop_codon:yes gene_type:complete